MRREYRHLIAFANEFLKSFSIFPALHLDRLLFSMKTLTEEYDINVHCTRTLQTCMASVLL